MTIEVHSNFGSESFESLSQVNITTWSSKCLQRMRSLVSLLALPPLSSSSSSSSSSSYASSSSSSSSSDGEKGIRKERECLYWDGVIVRLDALIPQKRGSSVPRCEFPELLSLVYSGFLVPSEKMEAEKKGRRRTTTLRTDDQRFFTIGTAAAAGGGGRGGEEGELDEVPSLVYETIDLLK